MTGLKNIIRSMKGNRSLYSSILLQTVIILMYTSTISAESSRQRQSSDLDSVTSQANMNKVVTYDDCKKYLCKYGYLDCNCQADKVRRKRQLADGLIPTEYSETPSPTSDLSDTQSDLLENSSMRSCTIQDFTTAFETFQLNYRLNVTGICDERTTLQMSQRRCGQSDAVIDKLDSDITETGLLSRKTRSLTEIISGNIEMEQTIERRKQQLKEYIKYIEQETVTPGPVGMAPSKRDRRSIYTSSNDYGSLLNKQRISWRLMSDHLYHIIPPSNQRSILRQAFRYWSEVAPLCFHEDTDRDRDVDIEIGFLEGIHLSCYRQFDGYGGELAHKFHRDVHFDNSEPYTAHVTESMDGISLLLVAVHELGHVIGLNHSNVASSVMNAIYHRSLKGDFELDDHDRAEVFRAYGPCYGRFDTVFDYVHTREGTKNTRVYNTYFFRNDHYWQYENTRNRTRRGDPLLVESAWKDIPDNVDTFLHYWEFDLMSMTFSDEYLFFKGDRFYSYDNTDSVNLVTSGYIRHKFLSSTSSNPPTHIPHDLDAAFYDQRNQVKLIYFFKGNLVYSYKYTQSQSHQCCVTIQPISSLFPPSTPSDAYSPDGNSYQTDLDSVYLSNSKRAVYFIKGNDTWINEDFFTTTRGNSMKYVGHWCDIWSFICDGECS